jgi:hypothetical protein
VRGKVLKSFMLNVASGSSDTKQQAAIHVSLTGRGRPRWIADAEIWPFTTATSSVPGITAIVTSQCVSRLRRAVPHLRRSAHLVISERVTKVISGCRPVSRAYIDTGDGHIGLSRPLCDNLRFR